MQPEFFLMDSNGSLADSLEKTIAALDECLEVNKYYLDRMQAYTAQAESFAKFEKYSKLLKVSHICSSRTCILHPFGQERFGRPPIPANVHTVQRETFARRFLCALELKPNWSESETSTLKAVLGKRYEELPAAGEISWEEVAEGCRSEDPGFKRTAGCCRVEYQQRLYVDSERAWTAAEEKLLSDLVSESGGTDWVRIGDELRRSASECYSHCYSKVHPVLVPMDFSSHDDERLAEIVSRVGEVSWSVVAMELGTGHTEFQCWTRWRKTLKPGIQSGRWNDVLDARLKAAISVYGEGRWIEIAQHVPGKTDRKCRERWSSKFALGGPKQEWDIEEDRKLLAAVAECGAGNWSKVKKFLPGRTDEMCRRRFPRIAPLEAAEEYASRVASKRETRKARRRENVKDE